MAWLLASAASRSFHEEELRDTGDLSVCDVTWRWTEDGYYVHGVLVNGGSRSASSVVLVGEVDLDVRLIGLPPEEVVAD